MVKSASGLGRPARIMREFPRHNATDSFVMSEANAVPELTDVAAAHTRLVLNNNAILFFHTLR